MNEMKKMTGMVKVCNFKSFPRMRDMKNEAAWKKAEMISQLCEKMREFISLDMNDGQMEFMQTGKIQFVSRQIFEQSVNEILKDIDDTKFRKELIETSRQRVLEELKDAGWTMTRKDGVHYIVPSDYEPEILIEE
jgi:hypothetical protein